MLQNRVLPVAGGVRIALAEAAGRVLAEPVRSRRPVPGFANAAVDGYAFAAASQPASGAFSLARAPGRAAAGHPAALPVAPGQALQILTGAMMPEGTDTVAMNEEVEADATAVKLERPLPAFTNRRNAGEDIRAGQLLFAGGTVLTARHVGVLAEVGLAEVLVFERLRVALLSSGDELCEPGEQLPPGAVFDANRRMLRALLRQLPVAVDDLGILPDDAGAVEASLLDAAASHDVVLTSGGASRGAEDHVVRAVERHGRLDFWQIAMKPGRPLAFGRLRDAVTIGLPGNPVAAAVCFMRFARPVLARLGGSLWPEPRAFRVPAAFALEKKPGRTELLRARLVADAAGDLEADLVRRQGSGILTSLTDADGLIEVAPATVRIDKGDAVRFFSFAELGAN